MSWNHEPKSTHMFSDIFKKKFKKDVDEFNERIHEYVGKKVVVVVVDKSNKLLAVQVVKLGGTVYVPHVNATLGSAKLYTFGGEHLSTIQFEDFTMCGSLTVSDIKLEMSASLD